MDLQLVEKLAALEEIGKLKARYCRFVDSKQWDALRDLFTPDCRFDGSGGGMGEIADRDQFLAEAAAGLAGCVSVHHVHNPEIEFTAPDRAEGIWAMEDMLRWEEASSNPLRSLHGMGHYRETYARIDGAWKIVAWAVTRLRVDVVPA